ncbi:MAG TPA: GAF domain-containing protein [Anaeromyxobacteraceae bacterium]|nr:GAF domain-containing protein [Anaeromyxobacteraceae bacterium]
MPNDRIPKSAADGAPGAQTGRDLKQVNDKLRELISSLKSNHERLTEVRAPAAAPAPRDPSPGSPAIDLEKKRLAAELALAREAVEHAQAERERLRARLDEIEAENRRICDEYVTVQEQSSELAQLYVALDRLHAGQTREETIAAIQEIVINVIGSEEFAILEHREGALRVVHAFGVDPDPLRAVPLDAGAIGRVARTGRLYVAGREGAPSPADGDLSACIPLRVGGEVWGTVAIFRLLGHKPSFGPSDQAVFDLLSAHAGLALHHRGGAGAPRAAAG